MKPRASLQRGLLHLKFILCQMNYIIFCLLQLIICCKYSHNYFCYQLLGIIDIEFVVSSQIYPSP